MKESIFAHKVFDGENQNDRRNLLIEGPVGYAYPNRKDFHKRMAQKHETRAKQSRIKRALLPAILAVGAMIGLAEYAHSQDADPTFIGHQTVTIEQYESLDQAIAENVEGINSVEFRNVRSKIIDNPINADVLKDEDGSVVHEGEQIDLPLEVK
jgi:hypothetical protein